MVTDVVGAQVDLGMRVAVACPPGTPLAVAAGARGAEVHPWRAGREPGPRLVVESRRIAELVELVRPDLVHAHSAKAGLAARIAVRGRVPTVYQPHAWSFEAVDGVTGALARRWERWAARWTDRVICVSEAERRRGEYAGVRASWSVVHNGVDTARFTTGPDRAAARAALGLPASAPLVVCVGRLCRQKGQDTLLAAWPAVLARVPHARLVLVGDGPAADSLRAAAGRIAAGGNGAWVGFGRAAAGREAAGRAGAWRDSGPVGAGRAASPAGASGAAGGWAAGPVGVGRDSGWVGAPGVAGGWGDGRVGGWVGEPGGRRGGGGLDGPDGRLGDESRDGAVRGRHLARGGGRRDGPGAGRGDEALDGGPSVTFVGAVADPAPWYRAADLVVQPSRWEGMALAPLEAMAGGRPVLLTDVDGARESLPPGHEAHCLVRPDDPAALGAALAGLLQRPTLREALGRQAQRHVLRRFDVRRAGVAIADVYREVTAAPRHELREPISQ
ncbi:glycosyltransferase [Streptomyces sp. CB03234]|uniref:glycosyltransferase n=1 Tax=Streptomyces sp. (strain CB03234) TaxID=1703937 RepID=UPI001F5218ED